MVDFVVQSLIDAENDTVVYVSVAVLMTETSPSRKAILDAIGTEDWIALRRLSLLPRGFEAARRDAW